MGNKSLTLWKPDGGFDNVTLNASLGAMNIDTLSTTRKVREPLARSENVMDQFDGITYRKGGGVLSMFESYLGEEKFRDGVRLHMKRYADSVATGDDFFQSIADGSGNPDVVSAMKSFVDQPGLPLVKVSRDGTALGLTQSRYAPLGSKTQQGQTWEIPVVIKMGFGDEVREQKILAKDKSSKIKDIYGAQSPDWIMPNANGAGYYRFTLDSAGWDALIANIDQLNTREVITMQDSLLAAFRAGEVESAVMVAGMEKLAKHENYEVADRAGDLLGFIYGQIPEARDDLAGLVQDMYKVRYTENLGQDTVEANLLNPTLAANLVVRGGDKALRREFVAKGAAYLGLDGAANKKAVAPNMLSRALREVMKARGEAAEKPLLALVKSGSSFEKGAAIGALGSTTNSAIASSLRDLTLSDTTAMTGRQALSLLSVMMGNEALSDETWDWVKANFTEFVPARVPDVRKGGMPGLAGNFCSLEKRDEAERFFKTNAAIIPGYERSLQQTLEAIELCAALKSEKAAELKAALKAR
jgi:alanyl aminopeptidase